MTPSTDPTTWATQAAVDALTDLEGAASALRQALMAAEPRAPKAMARLAHTMQQSTEALKEWLRWLETA